MGSWNKTCGLTRLPIIAGEDVYVFFLRERKGYIDRCYSTALWEPNLLNFQAKYNDYGGIEDVVEGNHTEALVQSMRLIIKPMEQGENQHHDIPVDPKTITLEGMQEAIHENRLFQSAYGDSQYLIDSTFIRKDIVDKIMNEYTFESYVGSGKGDCGYGNNYRMSSFKEYFDALPGFLSNVWDRLTAEYENEDDKVFARLRPFDTDPGYETMEYSLNSIFGYRNHRMFNTVDLWMIISILLDGGKKKDEFIKALTPLFESVLRGSLLNSFMEMTRQIWAPGCHEGSQSQNYDEYRFLIHAMHEAMDARDAECDD